MSGLAASLQERLNSESWRRAGGILRIFVSLLVAAFLFYKLQDIGWSEVWRNLPSSPWFYAVFVVNYISLPLFELGLYHMLWRTGLKGLPVFLRKRVYNEAIMEYSGEAYFYLWARRQTHLSEQAIFKTVRDVNILSALSANIVAFAVLGGVLLGGTPAMPLRADGLLEKGLIVTGLLGGLVLVLAITLRGRLLALSWRRCAGVTAIHMTRIGLALGLQLLQWHFALPGIGLDQWMFFLAIQLALSRLPLLPSKDLVFAGVAVSLAAQLNAPHAMVVGMFTACSALSLATNLGIYAISVVSGLNQRKTRPRP